MKYIKENISNVSKLTDSYLLPLINKTEKSFLNDFNWLFNIYDKSDFRYELSIDIKETDGYTHNINTVYDHDKNEWEDIDEIFSSVRNMPLDSFLDSKMSIYFTLALVDNELPPFSETRFEDEEEYEKAIKYADKTKKVLVGLKKKKEQLKDDLVARYMFDNCIFDLVKTYFIDLKGIKKMILDLNK